jgi:DNA-directed RNA polymerase subunit RPC12/RpoP
MVKVKCQKCKYEWITKSKLLKVSCPSCGSKVKNELKEDNKDK